MPETIPQPNRIWWYVAIGFATFWMFCLYFFVPGRQAPLENSGMSEPADYNWSPADMDGQRVPFAKLKGKTLFLNFWATWCGPCVREMPSISALAKNPRLKGKNIEFVCVSTDSSADAVRRFLAGKDWSMTILLADKVPSVFYSEAIPATFLIAPDGRIAATLVGATDWNQPHVVEFLEKLAGPSTSAR
jgi:thiol-disulfide isomerase/thioredoxin